MDNQIYMVFDVESVGLRGPSFAVGFVVVNDAGEELDSGYAATTPILKSADDETQAWLNENVLPALYGTTHEDASSVFNYFWEKWLEWKERGALLVSDVAWPVEANFLLVYMPVSYQANAPYPLLDVSSVLFAAGKDPVATFERQIGEKPAHNPLCDARQSARVLIETLRELRQNRELAQEVWHLNAPKGTDLG